jgi:hypothetical protein
MSSGEGGAIWGTAYPTPGSSFAKEAMADTSKKSSPKAPPSLKLRRTRQINSRTEASSVAQIKSCPINFGRFGGHSWELALRAQLFSCLVGSPTDWSESLE